MKKSIIAMAAFMLIACNKEQIIKVSTMESDNSIVQVKAHMYTRAQLNQLLNHDAKKMDGIRFYHEGYAVGTLKDNEGNYNDYTTIDTKGKKVAGLPCPDWCSK